MKGYKIIPEYFKFSRNDRLGITTMLIILGIVALFPKFLPDRNHIKISIMDTLSNTPANSSGLKNEKPNNQEKDSNGEFAFAPTKVDQQQADAKLYYFDPNTVSAEDWKKLGLRDKTIKIIGNYLNKGGHFSKAEDLQRIYGLQLKEYERLAPFIRIESVVSEKTSKYKSPKLELHSNNDNSNRFHYTVIDINTADTVAFMSLPAIGSKLSERIVKFREKLGGFHSVSQIGEIYGLADVDFQKIKPYLKLSGHPVKLNINTASKEQLKLHPYITWHLANAIVEYRSQHGNFSHLEDLMQISIVTNDIFQKLSPYLTIE